MPCCPLPNCCASSGPFSPSEAAAAESALQGIAPAGSWVNVRTERPGTWVVYMGSYPDRETLRRKEDEIRRLRPDYEEVSLPSEGEFGLSLGRFDDRALAERALSRPDRGIRPLASSGFARRCPHAADRTRRCGACEPAHEREGRCARQGLLRLCEAGDVPALRSALCVNAEGRALIAGVKAGAETPAQWHR